ncbi:hypothetical protein AURDEDRAFT_188541 [Auricularia subglabra TFB-10046 SS5]|uniref:CENP-V/GFA domain-containing protein n=1 Tax=Auricularia subglabra (strain TFB-10046 / SS5) TaxID=717982 RepID=J0WSB4_AURST|nr:hypothetical protein AURDEDRAFT_188541 [Auricularia subglabra TFB-10046 SS5]
MPPAFTTEPPVFLGLGAFKHHTYTGGCHCGRVKFDCVAPPPDELVVRECTCSWCMKRGALLIYLKSECLTWTKGGWEDLTTYKWNFGQAHHAFCPACGIQVGTTFQDVVIINARCIDNFPVDIHDLKQTYFDGKNLIPLAKGDAASESK